MKFFIVKVVVHTDNKNNDIQMYNKGRNLHEHISSKKCRVAKMLRQIILKDNSLGLNKGYFNAYIKENGTMFVNINPLPHQNW